MLKLHVVFLLLTIAKNSTTPNFTQKMTLFCKKSSSGTGMFQSSPFCCIFKAIKRHKIIIGGEHHLGFGIFQI